MAATAGGVGRALARRFDVSRGPRRRRPPTPASAAPALPAAAELGLAGLTPFVTPNRDFYRVDTALTLPQVARTLVAEREGHGRPAALVHLRRPPRPSDVVERDITLVCISNEVGGPYAGNARWLGVPLAAILDEVGVQDGADQLVSRSVDGFTAGTPTAVVTDGRDALVAFGMNGEPLPIAHGFPVRLVVPGVYGYNSATKWVSELELTTFAAYDAYWAARGATPSRARSRPSPGSTPRAGWRS